MNFFPTPPLPCFLTPSNLRKFFSLSLSFFSGLCSVYRSKAGKIPGGEEEEQPCHNSHWLRGPNDNLPLGGPSRYVGYYDAASLYPASSKYSERERELCFDFFAVRPRARRASACRRVLPGEGQARDRALATLLAAGGLGPAAKPPVGQGLRRQSVGESESARI